MGAPNRSIGRRWLRPIIERCNHCSASACDKPVSWATSCVTCVAEMPKLMATHDKYKARGYDTLAVAMQYDPPSYVVNFAQTRKLPFDVAIDNTGAVAKAWGDVQLTPTSYVVNKKGEIVKRYVGEPDFAELHQLIEKLLAES